MPGRKLLNDNRRIKPVSFYLTEEEFDTLTNYIATHGRTSSRAFFIMNCVMGVINGRYVDATEPKFRVYNYISESLSKTDAVLITSILKDKEKTKYLLDIIHDSKKLTK